MWSCDILASDPEEFVLRSEGAQVADAMIKALRPLMSDDVDEKRAIPAIATRKGKHQLDNVAVAQWEHLELAVLGGSVWHNPNPTTQPLF